MYNDSFLDTLAHAYRDARDKNESLAKYLIGVFHEIGVLHNDGGPGSGNHGHKGVPGKVGGSAPSGDNPITAKGPVRERLAKIGHTKETLSEVYRLFQLHSGNSRDEQAEADEAIAKHIQDGDDIGKALRDKAAMEEIELARQADEDFTKQKARYQEQLEDIQRDIQPGGPLENYSEEDLREMNLWPVEPSPVTPRFYRNGKIDRDVLAFTTNPDGAFRPRGGYEEYELPNTEVTLDEMKELGYRPVAGIAGFDVGAIGESEVLFAKFPNGREDGGPGSGNFGHEGRPGEVGGSAPSDDASDTPTATNPQAVSKRRANETIASILGNGESSDDRRDKLKKIVDQLHPGSKVQMPDTWENDDGTHVVYIKDDVNGESRWYQKYDGQKWYMSEDDLVYYMLSEYDNFNGNLCKVTSSAESEAEKRAAFEEWNKKYNWRYNASIWQDHGALTEQASIHMQKFDLDNCGYGFELTGSDGKKYIKDQYLGWVDSDTYKKADMRKLKNPTFEGDFFDINLGMNGVSAESCAKVREVYENLPEKLKTAYEDRFRNQSCFVQNPEYGVSHCDAYGNVSLTPDSSARTVFHEYGHSIDFYSEKINEFPSQHLDRLGNSPQQYRQDVEAMAKVVGLSTDGNGNLTESEADRTQKYWSWAKNQEKKIAGFENVSDAISALTHASCGEALYGGHESSYWYKVSSRGAASMRSAEFWAEYCQMKAFGQEEALDLMKQIAPNLYDACEKTYMEVIENG